MNIERMAAELNAAGAVGSARGLLERAKTEDGRWADIFAWAVPPLLAEIDRLRDEVYRLGGPDLRCSSELTDDEP